MEEEGWIWMWRSRGRECGGRAGIGRMIVRGREEGGGGGVVRMVELVVWGERCGCWAEDRFKR